MERASAREAVAGERERESSRLRTPKTKLTCYRANQSVKTYEEWLVQQILTFRDNCNSKT